MSDIRRIRVRAKRWIFALIPTVILAALATIVLSRLETAGRIETQRRDDAIAYPPARFITEFERDGHKFLRLEDGQFTRLEFPAEKSPDVFRIVIVGESFAAGTPYNLAPAPHANEGTPAGWLDVLLRIRFPDRHVEVIPAATGGATSGRVRQVAAELLEKTSPDLLVVAMGNNEGFIPGRLNEEMHQWIVYRALKTTLLSDPPSARRPGNMPQSANARDVLMNFGANLDAILDEAARHAAPVVLCTLPANLRYDIRPSAHKLGGLSPEFLRSDDALDRGRAALRGGEPERALAEFSRSANRGVVLFHIGECLELLGRYDEAREAFRAHLTLLPICRAGSRINDEIRDRANRPGVALCDLEAAIEGIAERGIPDHSLFFDSCHMRWYGYYHVANAILEAAIRARLLPANWGEGKTAPRVEEALGFAGWIGLPDRSNGLNRQYRVFQGDHYDPGEDPRQAVPLAFETPKPLSE